MSAEIPGDYLVAANLVMGVCFLLLFFITFYLIRTRNIKDLFMGSVMYTLALALVLRVTMSIFAVVTPQPIYGDDRNIPLQQIYFEIPFYAYVVVLIAFLFSCQQFCSSIDTYKIRGSIHINSERFSFDSLE